MDKYITLADTCSLRLLEKSYVYNKTTDELYELDDDGLEFLKRCDGTRTLLELGGEAGFLGYCFGEGIIAETENPSRRRMSCGPALDRSLRYLELHLTTRCNLRCRHCYLSAGGGRDLELIKVFKAMDDFDNIGGLRLLLSGGEPLLHRKFWYINERLADFGFRCILLTNGTLISRPAASHLKVQEAQVSIDGMKVANDLLRGEGTFERAVKGIENLLWAGVKVSVATVVTALNRGDFEEMRELMDTLGVSEWNVDVPSLSGRFKDNRGLLLDPSEAARYLSFGFGGGWYHDGPEGFACGAHLCAVGSRGQVAKCGFYLDKPVGDVTEGLRECWEKMAPVMVNQLDCDCGKTGSCNGGCRFRASTYTGEFGPDPVRCHAHGVLQYSMRGGVHSDDKEGC